MVKIIETNLSIDDKDNIRDHQSRVIEEINWEEYVNNFKNFKSKHYSGKLGSMHGYNFSKTCKLENLYYDDFHLSCDTYNIDDMKTKKLAYLIR